MTTDLTLAKPPDLIAAAIVVARARRACSHVGKCCWRLANARWLFTLVVDCDRIVAINSSSGSSLGQGVGTP